MIALKLTEQTFRAEHFHDIWHRIIEERHTHRISYGQLAILLGEQSAIVKGSHGIEPCLGGAVNETAINPSSHLIYLRSRFYCRHLYTSLAKANH